MKRLKQLFILWVLVLQIIGSSCSSHHGKQSSNVFILDYEKSESVPSIYLSEIADSISYIPLSNDTIVGRIWRLDIQDSLIVLSDVDDLYVFDLSGKFQNKIGQRGQGPKEYNSSYKFTVDSDHDKIYVTSRSELKAYAYDGTYLQTIKVHAMPDGWVKTIYMDNKFYLFEFVPPPNPESTQLWRVIDTTGTVIGGHHFYERFPKNTGSLITEYTTKAKDSIVYWNEYNDTIFAINAKGTHPLYVWTKGDYRATPKTIIGHTIPAGKMDLNHLYDTPRFLFLQYYSFDKPRLGIFNKHYRRFYHTNVIDSYEKGLTKGITNDMDGGVEFFPNHYVTINEEAFFIKVLQPESLLRLKELPDKPFSPALRDLRQRIHEEDNPILMLVRLKQ